MIYDEGNIKNYIADNRDIKNEIPIDDYNRLKTLSNKEVMNYVISNFFVSKAHKEKIEQKYQFSENYCFSFRRAGYYTIKNIERGAAPKPHRILDKSIKSNEVKDRNCAMIGLVPFRDANNRIIGLYITKEGFNHFKNICTIYNDKNEKKNMFIKPNGNEDIEEWFKNLTKAELRMSWFITGDYDMHEIIAHNQPVVSDGYDEARVLLELATTMMGKTAGSIDKGKFEPNEYSPIQHSPIQHGAQYNYIAHMKDKESQNTIVREVANFSLDVAYFYKEGWTIIYSTNEQDQSKSINTFYTNKIFKNLKWSWKNDEKAQKYINQFTPAKNVNNKKEYEEYSGFKD